MKISSVNQSEAVSKYYTVGETPAKTSPKVNNISDKVELSEGAQKFSALVKAAKESLSTSGSEEEAKVSEIIAQIRSNSYDVSTDDVVRDIMRGVPSGSVSKGE